MIKKSPLTILCLFCALVHTMAIANETKGNASEHLSAVFGIIVETQDGQQEFEVSNVVPALDGQPYGWKIQLPPGISLVVWKEVFELPASPQTWGAGELNGQLEVSDDRKVSVTEKEVVVIDGYIQHFWRVVRGDPIGNYVIRVYIDDVLLETFRFVVIGE